MRVADNFIVYIDGKHNGVAGFSGTLPNNTTPEQRLTKRLQQLFPGKSVSVAKVK